MSLSKGTERKVEQFEHYQERWNWRLMGGEETWSKWLASPPGIMVRSQSEMPLRAVSVSMVMQCSDRGQ